MGRRPQAAGRAAELTWSTAVPDWERRIAAGQSLIPALPLNKARADKALRIFKRFRMVDVIGQPTMGEACAPWVFDLVRAIFGAFDPERRRQLIREFFFFVAKKNGKSSIAAGIMMTALVMNERVSGEFLILAPTKDVADNSFTPAYQMVKADKALLARYKPSDTTREIVDRLDGSVLSVKSADADVLGGQKAIAVFIDELWLFGKKASAANILSEATGSLAARPEGFVVYASTQSDDPPAGVFASKLRRFRQIRDGVLVDRSSLPVIYEYPVPMQKAQAWLDPKTWHIPNPSLGRSVDEEWLSGKLAEHTREGPAALKLFLAKHFNVEIGLGLKTDGWIGANFWERRADTTLTLDDLIARSEVITVGADGGGLDDLYGLAVLGREVVTRRWLLWCHAWCHDSVLELRKDIASRLLDLEAAGELTIVRDLGRDIDDIVDTIMLAEDAGKLDKVGLDPAGIGSLVDALDEKGINGDRIVGIPQGWKLVGAIKTAERKLADSSLLHAGQALMAWCVGNAKVEPRGNAILITKQAAGSAKIDPLMAMFNAVALMSMNPEAPGRSIYDWGDLWASSTTSARPPVSA